jgi:hypothetical protein
MLLLFEKRVLKNQEMRIKFAEQPEKFMESELELHDILNQLHSISTVDQTASSYSLRNLKKIHQFSRYPISIHFW